MDTLLRDRPIVDVLTSAIDRDKRALLDELARCSDGLKTKRVHTVRTTVRRLLAALELAATLGAPAKTRVARNLGKLLSALSPLRDSQVQLRSLEAMTRERGDLSGLPAQLEKQKRALARTASRQLARFDADRFQQDMATVTQKLAAAAMTMRDGNAARSAIHGDLARRYLKVSRERRRATAEDPRSLHRLRLELKAYRYGLAAVAPALPTAVAEVSESVARLQAQLGAAQDAHVLAKTATAPRKSQGRRAAKRVARAFEHMSRAAQSQAFEAVKNVELDWPF